MAALFEPYAMGPLALRNRFIRSATGDNLVDGEGLPSEPMARWYEAMAQSGVAMINTGMVKPRASWLSIHRTFSLVLTRKSQVAAYRRLTGSVHRHGALITAQATAYFFGRGRRLGPSRFPEPGEAEEASAKEIQTAVRIYGDLAALVREANFDALQVHAAHGYALHQFLSPFFNRRED
ncbi:MAG TPA: hypothetical protein VLS90_20625, partial [Thermodesulfobacteriota bacterium]|nr:hypothetical protein [Thermodesulfobacteriota bacterium]